MAKKKKDNYRYHRPISITIENVKDLPTETEIPPETLMTVNIKGNKISGKLLIDMIQKQIKNNDFFIVTIEGVS